MKLKIGEKVALLGVGSGLGLETYRILEDLKLDIASWSRHQPEAKAQFFAHDFSRSEQWDQIVLEIKEFAPQRLFYFAGGGPYGAYGSKKWSSHRWAFDVNFLFPAFLLHSILSEKKDSPISQILFVGSAIAENSVDPQAASYSAAKHGLRGLVCNLASENKDMDIRLFSPGYMKTKLLPTKSIPVSKGLAREPRQVAIEIIDWLQQEPGVSGFHKISS